MSNGNQKASVRKSLDWVARLRAMPNDSTAKTLIVAIAVCLICSVIVSSVVVLLRPTQEANKALDQKEHILEVVGLLNKDTDVDQQFKQVEKKVVDLATGDYVGIDRIDPATYDQHKAPGDPMQSTRIPPERDVANIGWREKYSLVYLVKQNGRTKYVIIPVRGLGLYSTLHGFLALEADAITIHGFSVYEHEETPGLGGEVDSPKWRAQWKSKVIYDENGDLQLRVIKGSVDASKPDARYQVDGLTGATLTSRGVHNMLRYWLGDDGFGPFLKKINSAR